jgi:hypothetical protein
MVGSVAAVFIRLYLVWYLNLNGAAGPDLSIRYLSADFLLLPCIGSWSQGLSTIKPILWFDGQK